MVSLPSRGLFCDCTTSTINRFAALNIYVKIFYSCKNIYLAAWSGAGDGGAEPLVRAHLVPAGRLGGAGHDVVDGGAVASSLGQGTLPHTARPATHGGQGDTEQRQVSV